MAYTPDYNPMATDTYTQTQQNFNDPKPQKFQPGMTANAGETPEQTAQRYKQDYWAPDRDQVLGGPPGPKAQTPAQPGGQQPQKGGGGTAFPNMGGGWGQNNSPAASALQNAFAQGLTG